MFRILCVEDYEPVLNLLTTELQKAFVEPDGEKGLKVYPAKSVEEGLRLIEKGHDDQRPFHAAILDFKLPRDIGENPEMDESLCLAIKRKMPGALVVHITAYDSDSFVANHINIFHLGRRGSEADVLAKQGDWPTKLEDLLKRFLYGARIEQQLERLFGADYTATPYSSRTAFVPTRSQGERSFTHALASLSRDIESHWDALSEETKFRIKEIFRVDKYHDTIRLSLIRDRKGKE